ncbi:hypothetical protein [Xanthobacter autotrophicus]|uniref:hypothetical protein n=1 Tax=Xanthobacter autotrophicus TaxID=280 RepID=UPI00372897DB
MDILDRIADAEAVRARDLKTVTQALKPLVASLTPEQQRRIPAFLGLREGAGGLPQPTAEIWLFEEENGSAIPAISPRAVPAFEFHTHASRASHRSDEDIICVAFVL